MVGYSRADKMTSLAIKERAQIKAAAGVGGVTDLAQLHKERRQFTGKGMEELSVGDRNEYKKRSAWYWPQKSPFLHSPW